MFFCNLDVILSNVSGLFKISFTCCLFWFCRAFSLADRGRLPLRRLAMLHLSPVASWALVTIPSCDIDASSIFEIQIGMSLGGPSISSIPINSSLNVAGIRNCFSSFGTAQELSTFSASVFAVSICDVWCSGMFLDAIGSAFFQLLAFCGHVSCLVVTLTCACARGQSRVFPEREISNLAVDRVTAPVSQDYDIAFIAWARTTVGVSGII